MTALDTVCETDMKSEALRTMSERDFLRAWRDATGGPPAIMLDRDAMIAMLEELRGPETADQFGSSPGSHGPNASATV